jgi:hypothetical protein
MARIGFSLLRRGAHRLPQIVIASGAKQSSDSGMRLLDCFVGDASSQ